MLDADVGDVLRSCCFLSAAQHAPGLLSEVLWRIDHRAVGASYPTKERPRDYIARRPLPSRRARLPQCVCHPAGAPSPQPDRHGRPVRVLPPDQWDTPPADFQVAV